MAELAEELEAVQSIFMDDLAWKEEGGRHIVRFTVDGQEVLVLTLGGEL